MENLLFQEKRLESRLKLIVQEKRKVLKQKNITISDDMIKKLETANNHDIYKSHNSNMLNLYKPKIKETPTWIKTPLGNHQLGAKIDFKLPNDYNLISNAIFHIKIPQIDKTCRYIDKADCRIIDTVIVKINGKIVQNYTFELYTYLDVNKNNEHYVEYYDTNNNALSMKLPNPYSCIKKQPVRNFYVPIILGGKIPSDNEVDIEIKLCDQLIIVNENINDVECNLYTEHLYSKFWDNIKVHYSPLLLESYEFFTYNLHGKNNHMIEIENIKDIDSIYIGIKPIKNYELQKYWYINKSISFTKTKILADHHGDELLWYEANIPKFANVCDSIVLRMDGDIVQYDLDINFMRYLASLENQTWISYKNLENRSCKKIKLDVNSLYEENFLVNIIVKKNISI